MLGHVRRAAIRQVGLSAKTTDLGNEPVSPQSYSP